MSTETLIMLRSSDQLSLGSAHANRVEPADTSDRLASALLLGGLRALFPRIRTAIADVGHQSRKLARSLEHEQGWQLRIVRRRQRAFKITGLTLDRGTQFCLAG